MANEQHTPNSDQEQLYLLIVFIAAMVGIYFLYTWMQQEINAFIGVISLMHVYPFAMLVEIWPELRSMQFIGPMFFAKAELTYLFLDQGNFAYMSPSQRQDVLTSAGICALPIYLPFMIYAATSGNNFRPDLTFKNSYSLDNMIKTQSQHWPSSRKACHVNPLKMPEISAGYLARNVVEKTEKRRNQQNHSVGKLIHVPFEEVMPNTWHRAMRPEEWLVAQGLCLDDEHIHKAKEKDWRYPDMLLESRDKWHDLTLDTLMESLAAQLRQPWHGFEKLRPCHRAICAVMSLFYDYDIQGGNELLDDLGRVNDSIKGKTGGMDKAIKNENGLPERIEEILGGKPGKNILDIANNHAWMESAFPSMLASARKDRGVLPAAAFVWLKSEDRRLWYILDNVGSEAVMIESAGAMSHYRAEIQIGKPIRRPAVYQAARALLEDYLDMTPERIAARKSKEERSRTAGDQIKILMKENQAA